jgi:hypothetical protein
MTRESKLLCGIIVLTIPTIEYGGYFLLSVLSGKNPELELNEFQRAMFRAGHAHAGVIVILSLVCQLLADHASLSRALLWFTRAGVPAAALLIPAGFFFSAMGRGATKPDGWIALLYIGVVVLAAALIILGIGLLRSFKRHSTL